MFYSSKNGYTLLEIIIVVGLSAILFGGAMHSMTIIFSANQEIIGNQALAAYSTEVRSLLTKSDPSTAKPFCMNSLESHITASTLDQVLQLAGQGAQGEVELGVFNPLNSGSLDYGDLKVQRVTMSDVFLVKSHHGYSISQPAEIKTADKKPILIYTISAHLNIYLKAVSERATQRAQIRIALAIMKKDDGRHLLDCGVGSLSRTTAVVDVCKSFGSDFEYFIDGQGGNQLGGQCYAPIYDTAKQVPGFVADGNHRAQVTGYTPLRGFLCEGAIERKSFDFHFCTGVN